MKTLRQIKEETDPGDQQRMADMLQISKTLVSLVLNGDRPDYHNIQLAFSIMLQQRETLKQKIKQLNKPKMI